MNTTNMHLRLLCNYKYNKRIKKCNIHKMTHKLWEEQKNVVCTYEIEYLALQKLHFIMSKHSLVMVHGAKNKPNIN